MQNFRLNRDAMIFWAKLLINPYFHMNIPCDRIFFLVQCIKPFFLYIWPIFKQNWHWSSELSYCMWAFLRTRSFYWFQDICHVHLGHLWNFQLSWPSWPSWAFMFHKHILFGLKIPNPKLPGYTSWWCNIGYFYIGKTLRLAFKSWLLSVKPSLCTQTAMVHVYMR